MWVTPTYPTSKEHQTMSELIHIKYQVRRLAKNTAGDIRRSMGGKYVFERGELSIENAVWLSKDYYAKVTAEIEKVYPDHTLVGITRIYKPS
jgi:hypothetical protein